MIAVHLAGDEMGLAFVDDSRAVDPDLTEAVYQIIEVCFAVTANRPTTAKYNPI